MVLAHPGTAHQQGHQRQPHWGLSAQALSQLQKYRQGHHLVNTPRRQGGVHYCSSYTAMTPARDPKQLILERLRGFSGEGMGSECLEKLWAALRDSGTSLSITNLAVHITDVQRFSSVFINDFRFASRGGNHCAAFLESLLGE